MQVYAYRILYHNLAACFGVMLLKQIDKSQFKLSLKRKGKGKAIPLQAWIGTEGSRRLRLPDFKTFGT